MRQQNKIYRMPRTQESEATDAYEKAITDCNNASLQQQNAAENMIKHKNAIEQAVASEKKERSDALFNANVAASKKLEEQEAAEKSVSQNSEAKKAAEENVKKVAAELEAAIKMPEM